jgi:uridine kinase
LVVYSVAYLVFFWLDQSSDLFDAWKTILPSLAAHVTPYVYLKGINPALAAMSGSVSFTILQASLAGVVLHMYLMGVRKNDAHNAPTTPVMIGVAGDSGAGKNKFVRLITDMIGEEQVTVVAGDDYHRWPRGHKMWGKYTHLNMRANDLHRQHRDAVLFSSGQPVLKSEYDHHTGTSTEQQLTEARDVIIFQGLHTLSIEALRRMCDLTIFLDPDESLRWSWKIERDGRERGYTPDQVRKALFERQPDREEFVLPQMQDANIVVRWRTNAAQTADLCIEPTSLEVFASNSFNFEEIVGQLKLLKDMHVDHEYLEGRKQIVKMTGKVNAQTVTDIARRVINDHTHLLPDEVQFHAGLEGCLQLLFTICLTEKLSWRQPQTP